MLRMEIALFLVTAFVALAELCNFLLPLTYAQTPEGNYSSGPICWCPMESGGVLPGAVRGAVGDERAPHPP